MATYCNICGSGSGFTQQELGREGWLCKNCSASNRHRAVMYGLGLCLGSLDSPVAAWKPHKELKILESSGRGSYPMMLKDKFDYYNTEYDPNSELIRKPFSHIADFQQLAYGDSQLDFIIASDVFEHVREDERAFREMYRTLKPSGIFVLTVPYVHEWEQTLIRVKVEGDKDIHLLPPEYHGGGGQTLSYRTYGRDLMDRLRVIGFSVAYVNLDVPECGITPQAVFLCGKASYVDLTPMRRALAPANSANHASVSPLIPFRVFLLFKYNLLSMRHFLKEIVRRATDAFSGKPKA